MSKDKKGNTALITGATSGFGYEFAKLFAKDGYDLVIVARSRNNLNKVAKEIAKEYGVNVTAIPMDLSKAKSPESLYAAVKKKRIAVDVLVNNAGFGTYGTFSKTDLAEELEMIQLNVTSLTHLAKLFLKEMVKRKEGKILNVASMGSFQPGPFMAIYCATKAYVLSFSEALAEEHRGSGITVTALCPGVVLTGFQKRAKNVDSPVNKGKNLDAPTVAGIGYRALMKGKAVVIPGFKPKFLIFLNRLSPRSMARMVAGKMVRIK